jgi:glycosyltransferase involved in cell wall biosynthesis
MKVLHVIPSIAVESGGPSRAIVDIEQALSARGVEVTTVTTDDDGKGGRIACAAYGKPLPTDYATRVYFPRTTAFYTVSTALRRWLKDNIRKYDLVHAHALFSFAPVMAAHYARGFDVPYVLRPLGVLRQYGMTRRRPFLKRASLSLIERRLIEGASAVHFTSEAEREDAELLGLRFRAAVIPLGIRTSGSADNLPVPSQPKENLFTLLFLSRLDPIKNIEGLLRALALVAPKYPQLRLHIAGAGDAAYVQKLRELAQQLGVSGRVKWLGFVQGQQKTELFRDANAFVLSSFSESFGIAAVEALAEGLPIIVSRGVGIAREIEAAGAGIAVDPRSDDIALAIKRLLDDPERLTIMRNAGQRLLREEFSLDRMGGRLLALYDEILEPAATSAKTLLDQITPMILTFNEEANIERTLSKLAWAKRIVVVDSGSTDKTLEIISGFPQAVVVHRKFDTAAKQGNCGLQNVDTDWVLSMDADYVLSEELIEELRRLRPDRGIRGFAAKFVYKIYGRPLSGSLYPDRTVLYRRGDAIYRDEGHTQRVHINGRVSHLQGVIYHDDRKSLDRWFNSQVRYAGIETTRLLDPQTKLDWMDRLRLMIFPAPIVAFCYALLVGRGILDGWPGWYYALQRLCAEVILSVHLLDAHLLRRGEAGTGRVGRAE